MSTSPIGGPSSPSATGFDDPLEGGGVTATSSGGITWGAFPNLDKLSLAGSLLGVTISNVAYSDPALAELLVENDKLRRANENAKNDSLSARIRSSIEERTAIAEQLMTIEEDVAGIEAEKSELTTRRDTLQEERDSRQDTLDGLNEDIAVQQGIIDEQDHIVSEQQGVIDEQEAIIADIDDRIAELSAEPEPPEDPEENPPEEPVDHSEEISELQADRDAAVSLRDAAADGRNAAIALRDTAIGERDALSEQAELLQQDIDGLEDQITALDSGIADRNDQLAAQELELEQLLADNPIDTAKANEAQAQRQADNASVTASLDDAVFDRLGEDLMKLARKSAHQIPWLQSAGERETRIYNDDNKIFRPVKKEDTERQAAARIVAVFNAIDQLKAAAPDQPETKRQKLLL